MAASSIDAMLALVGAGDDFKEETGAPKLSWWPDSDESEDSHQSEDSNAETLAQETAGEEFLSYLLKLRASGKLHANDVCILSFWAARAGAAGRVRKVGMGPGKASGNYARHLDKVLDVKLPVPVYNLHAPGRERQEATRSILPFPPAQGFRAMMVGDRLVPFSALPKQRFAGTGAQSGMRPLASRWMCFAWTSCTRCA